MANFAFGFRSIKFNGDIEMYDANDKLHDKSKWDTRGHIIHLSEKTTTTNKILFEILQELKKLAKPGKTK